MIITTNASIEQKFINIMCTLYWCYWKRKFWSTWTVDGCYTNGRYIMESPHKL